MQTANASVLGTQRFRTLRSERGRRILDCSLLTSRTLIFWVCCGFLNFCSSRCCYISSLDLFQADFGQELRSRRPATGVSRPFGPECPGECLRECPRIWGCPTKCLRGVFGALRNSRVSKKCPESVSRVSQTLWRDPCSWSAGSQGRNFLPELCGEVCPETAPLQALCCALRSTEQTTF